MRAGMLVSNGVARKSPCADSVSCNNCVQPHRRSVGLSSDHHCEWRCAHRVWAFTSTLSGCISGDRCSGRVAARRRPTTDNHALGMKRRIHRHEARRSRSGMKRTAHGASGPPKGGRPRSRSIRVTHAMRSTHARMRLHTCRGVSASRCTSASAASLGANLPTFPGDHRP